MLLNITSSHITIESLPPGTASIDVAFDGLRIWSIDVRDITPDPGTPMTLEWPDALQPHLTGSTRVSVADSATGAELWAIETAFDGAAHRTSVVDTQGAHLAVNKWGRLGVALEDMGADVQALILQRATELIAFLDARGLRPFVVGGTLLGAVREQALLPHDDDADIAYLSQHTNPADVAIEAFWLGHELEAAGYRIMRHSAAHMQLLFRAREDSPHPVDYYIDVFTAFFTADGLVNQPFHVRGEMREEQMLPFVPVRIGQTEFPGPADTDRWLTINYDANWRTPIPGYRLETPLETRLRFDGWFGAFNLHREYWDEEYTEASPAFVRGAAAWAAGREWLAAGEARSGTIIDLGCGAGELTRQLAAQRPTRRVIGADFSDAALARAALGLEGPDHGAAPEWVHVNLYRATALALAHDLGVAAPFDLVANHVFEQIGHHGREWAWRLARMALRSGGSARFTFHGKHAENVRFEDPTGWHLTREQLTEEAATLGLTLSFEALGGDRDATGATVSLVKPRSITTALGGIR